MYRRRPLTVLAVLLVTGATAAQGRHAFVVDEAASAYTYSGSVSIPVLGGGPIVGQPTNMFNQTGTLDMDLTLASGVITDAQFVGGGSRGTNPDISAIIPNPIPFLPPLASFSMTGLATEMVSVDPLTLAPLSFPVVGGVFTTDVVTNYLAGTLTITAFGTTTPTDLTGQQTAPATLAGTLVTTPSGFQLDVPTSVSTIFSDPASGVSGNFTINGNLRATWRPLNSDVQGLSAGAGGTQSLVLSTGGSFGGDVYLVLGSASGTSPGFPVGAHVLPLNVDAFFGYTLANAGVPPLLSTFGLLDPLGKGAAAIVVPPAPSLAGLSLHWAFGAANPGSLTVDLTSNPEPLAIGP